MSELKVRKEICFFQEAWLCGEGTDRGSYSGPNFVVFEGKKDVGMFVC